MLLSTSNSDTASDTARAVARLDRFTVVLLGTVLTLLAVAEVVSVTGFDHISRVQRRELLQRQALLTVRDSTGSGSAHVAVVGNSLLLEGLDVQLLAAKMDPKFVPVPYFVLATDYYDWFFGLKRLFAEGMRPRYVLLGLSPNQFASPRTRGDYSARYLFQTADLVNVVRQTRMDATAASGFVLSHFSEYYSTRDVIRRFLLSKLLPSVAELLHNRLENGRAPEIGEAALRQFAAERLPALDRLCRENGSRIVIVIPPTYQKGAETISRIGREMGVTVLVPVPMGGLDESYYSDGFHLNNRGARIFTERLAANLRDELRN